MPSCVTHSNSPLDRLLTVRDLCEMLRCSDRALRRWIIAGRFPPADLVLGSRQLRWRTSTVRGFIGEHPNVEAAHPTPIWGAREGRVA